MEKVILKKDFPEWMKSLKAYKIYAPCKTEDFWSYKIIEEPESIDLVYPNTKVPAKEIIYPQREVLFEFKNSDQGPQLFETLPQQEQVVVFGLRPCEGRAFILYDKVFGGQFEDLYYWRRRKATVLVGLACNTPPSPNCFCLSVNGSPHSKEGLDVLMTELDNSYYIESLSPKGEKLLKEAEKKFRQPKAEEKKLREKLWLESEKKVTRNLIELESIHSKLKDMFDSSFWDEESMSCIRCGICTYLCPTCHCFDMNDELASSSPLIGKRVRTWDTCQFPDFTMHSSGHNPRPDKASRLRQRILHKFQYFVETFGNYQCTGCGRCISLCPVGIDIIEVLNKVRDYES